MSTEEETPYALAKRLHAAGAPGSEIERQLRERGLDEEEARIAARAGRGEAGMATALVEPVSALPVEPPAEAPTHPCPVHAQWPVKATCSRCGKFVCARCLTDAGLTAMPASNQCPECEARAPHLQGIGGWLALPALHVAIVGPLSIVAGIYQGLMAIPEVDSRMHPPLLIEIVFHLGLLALTVTAAVAFFRRKRSAVLWMIAFYSGLLLSQLVSMVLVSWMEDLAGMPLGGGERPGRTAGAFASSMIWIAYFATSKRVKQTFVVP